MLTLCEEYSLVITFQFVVVVRQSFKVGKVMQGTVTPEEASRAK
jgi:hypothetical protein